MREGNFDRSTEKAKEDQLSALGLVVNIIARVDHLGSPVPTRQCRQTIAGAQSVGADARTSWECCEPMAFPIRSDHTLETNLETETNLRLGAARPSGGGLQLSVGRENTRPETRQ